MNFIDVEAFIRSHVIKRERSLFQADIDANVGNLNERINGKSVLVIGGAGTIGSSFIKAILQFEPASLYVVDTNENGLTELTRNLRSTPKQFVPENYKSYPMNFADAVFEKMLKHEGPFDIVANFAAHKHVRSEKDKYSIEAMLENNVFKAKRLLDVLAEAPPSHFFCVSTDKAANPANVMGASKKLMEEVIMAYSATMPISTARFANVAFSNGSLLDGYIQRMMRNQALSCPADVRRFFVSPEESGQICMLACVLGKSGDIFFPKLEDSELTSFKSITEFLFEALGKPMHVCSSEDEAKQISANMTDGTPYPVYFFDSETSGEKHFEEFYTDDDEVDWNRFNGLGVVSNAKKPARDSVETVLNGLHELMQLTDYNKADIVAQLQSIIPGFEHIETGKSLDQKM